MSASGDFGIVVLVLLLVGVVAVPVAVAVAVAGVRKQRGHLMGLWKRKRRGGLDKG